MEDDAADRGRRRIECPVLALRGAPSETEPGRDFADIWRDWATDVRIGSVACGHFLAEEAPAETLAALEPFLTA